MDKSITVDDQTMIKSITLDSDWNAVNSSCELLDVTIDYELKKIIKMNIITDECTYSKKVSSVVITVNAYNSDWRNEVCKLWEKFKKDVGISHEKGTIVAISVGSSELDRYEISYMLRKMRDERIMKRETMANISEYINEIEQTDQYVYLLD